MRPDDPRTPARRPRAVRLATVALAVLATACGGRQPFEPGPPPPVPDLRGIPVMLLPVRAPAPGQIDAELAFWLGERLPTTEWLLPDELQRALDRAPAWRVQLDGMARRVGDRGGGNYRILDPLYGTLRQLGAIMDASYALVPVRTGVIQDSLGTVLRLSAAVVDIRGGRVLWLHTVDGEPAATEAAAGASAAERLARMLSPP
ncbi:MAG: hypothetical protein P8177_05345 [Gemmatimonadota bacterium]